MTQSQNNGVSLIIVPPFSGYRPSLHVFLPYKEVSFKAALPDPSDLLVIMLQTGLFLQFSSYKIAIYYPISLTVLNTSNPGVEVPLSFLQTHEASPFSGPQLRIDST